MTEAKEGSKMPSAQPLTKPYEKLTQRQKLFIEYYLQTQNAKESCIRAGYSENQATNTGTKLKQMLMPYMQDRLAEIQKKKDEEVQSAIMDTNEILATLTRIARGEEKDAFGLDTSNQDKLKALELLGKANQLYIDKVKQETNLDINVNLVGDDEEEALIGETAEPELLEAGEE